jgi:ubiquinone/menaquinone biosynthesis C-methylase UbiE
VPELARSFGRIAADYDAARPEYAPEAIERAAATLGLDRQARVLDLAAGSGTLTRALAGRFENLVVVEPEDAMRAILASRSSQVEALAGSAEQIPLPDAAVDALFVGDAFHWFDAPAAVAEFARVVRPGGGVALLWNHWWSDGDDGTSNLLEPPLPAPAQQLLDDVYVSSGRAGIAADLERDPIAALAGSPFTAPVEESFERSLDLSADEVVSLFTTISSVATLPTDEREELKRKLRGLLSGTFRLRVITALHWARRV